MLIKGAYCDFLKLKDLQKRIRSDHRSAGKMKMSLTIIVTTILLWPVMLNAQLIDTIDLKREVMELLDHTKRHKFLTEIYEIDQKYRGNKTNEIVDFKNLISISYYINEYGYPKKQDFPNYANVPSLIWVHNKYVAIDKISFPILLKGFLNGEIPENEIRNYYLRGLYNLKYDDDGYRTIPLKELFDICEVSTEEDVSIIKLLENKIKEDQKNDLSNSKVSNWKSDDTKYFYGLNGQKIERQIVGQQIKFIEKDNGKIYFLRVYLDNSGDLIELEKITKNKYKIKNKKTDRYFEIKEHTILYKEKNEIIDVYISISN